jgi:hypothetical protein
MWKWSEKVIYVLECLGVIEKIDTPMNTLQLYFDKAIPFFLIVGCLVSVLFFLFFTIKALECVAVFLCIVFSQLKSLFFHVSGWIYRVLAWPVYVLLDVTRFIERILSFFWLRLDTVKVPTETPPSFVSDEHRAEMERLVQKAEEIAARSNQDIPEAYLCPIGHTVMVIPVITGTGYTYDMEGLSVWFEHNNTCPCTRAQTRMLSRNLVLQGLIEKWAQDVIANHTKVRESMLIVEPRDSSDLRQAVIANHTNVHESMSIVEPRDSSDLRQGVIANHTNVHESMSIVEPRDSSDLRQDVTRIRAAVARAENLEQALARLRGAVNDSESDWGDSDSDTDSFENWDFQDL